MRDYLGNIIDDRQTEQPSAARDYIGGILKGVSQGGILGGVAGAVGTVLQRRKKKPQPTVMSGGFRNPGDDTYAV